MKVGQIAPDFKLKDKDGTLVSLKDLKGSQVVVYFYPKDDTPGCTLQAKGYSKALSKFEKLGVTVLGISGGDEKTKQKFCTKHKLKVTLLSDPDFAVAKKYGAFGDKVFMGRKYKGIFRNTYVLDKNLKVQHVLEKVDPEADVEMVLGVLQGKKLDKVAAKSQQPPKKKAVAKKKSASTAIKAAQKKATTKKVAKKKAAPAKKSTKVTAVRKTSKSMR